MSPFVDIQPPREHIRCALCGRLARLREGEDLPSMLNARHDLEHLTQSCVGKGQGGFQWERAPLDRERLRALAAIARQVSFRLDSLVTWLDRIDGGERDEVFGEVEFAIEHAADEADEDRLRRIAVDLAKVLEHERWR